MAFKMKGFTPYTKKDKKKIGRYKSTSYFKGPGGYLKYNLWDRFKGE
tara:strand:- start:327 stop:467 length:141 start_codon:yes stop_codon:yes gene_type:complete